MLKVTIYPTTESAEALNRVFDRLEQLPKVVADELALPLADFVRELGIKELFEREGVPPWTHLALPTVKQRIRLGFPGSHPILVRTGALRASLLERGHSHNITVIEKRGNSVTIVLGTTDPRFGVLHAGYPAKNIPARPMLPEGAFMEELMTRAEAELLIPRIDEAIKD